MPIPATFNKEDAFHYIVRYLREGPNPRYEYAAYGYGIYLPNVMRQYLSFVGIDEREVEVNLDSISPHFYAAAWELCRRGIIRPGLAKLRGQATDDGSSGNGYSITPQGSTWIQQAGQYHVGPIEPGRFAKLLESFVPRFGYGFRERCQEAIRCYGANAYLACCAMCGAAAESIVLALTITKSNDESLKPIRVPGGEPESKTLSLGNNQGIFGMNL